jgi:hypothetical protein
LPVDNDHVIDEGMTEFRDIDYTVNLAGYRFGFVDVEIDGQGMRWTQTYADLGPLGRHNVPFSAKEGWAITIVAPLLLLFVALSLARRRGRSQPE